MNRKEAEAVGRRALVTGFPVTPGALYQRRVKGLPPLRVAFGLPGCYPGRLPGIPSDAWPDFRDAATRGILMEQVCKRLGLESWNSIAENSGDLHPSVLVDELEGEGGLL